MAERTSRNIFTCRSLLLTAIAHGIVKSTPENLSSPHQITIASGQHQSLTLYNIIERSKHNLGASFVPIYMTSSHKILILKVGSRVTARGRRVS